MKYSEYGTLQMRLVREYTKPENSRLRAEATSRETISKLRFKRGAKYNIYTRPLGPQNG